MNFDVDANGKITIGGQKAYLTSDGNLTTNDAGGATAATLDGLFKKAGDGQSIGFKKTASVTMGEQLITLKRVLMLMLQLLTQGYRSLIQLAKKPF